MHCYVDDILGLTYGDGNGPRLAISDFNAADDARKISPIFALKYFVRRENFDSPWTETMFMAHVLDHARYGDTDDAVNRRLDLNS